jgi:pimeloyl-ACP methyl ester carboxylesterase
LPPGGIWRLGAESLQSSIRNSKEIWVSTHRRTTGKSRVVRLITALAATVALIALATTTSSAMPSHARSGHSVVKPTIVLVHGAWADASSWSREIMQLQADGYPVIAPANPLRSLSGDSAYIASVLAQTPGPLVVVGHSYGGAVITNAAAGNVNVRALVYVDAFIPDVGESIQNLGGAGSQIPASIEFKGYPPFGATDVDVYLKQDTFRSTFAADLSVRRAAELWASQRPLGLAALTEPTTAAAWKTIPSWALIGKQDNAITPDQQRFMTKRAGSTTVEINSSHVSLISHSRAVVDLIEQAATATAGS